MPKCEVIFARALSDYRIRKLYRLDGFANTRLLYDL